MRPTGSRGWSGGARRFVARLRSAMATPRKKGGQNHRSADAPHPPIPHNRYFPTVRAGNSNTPRCVHSGLGRGCISLWRARSRQTPHESVTRERSPCRPSRATPSPPRPALWRIWSSASLQSSRTRCAAFGMAMEQVEQALYRPRRAAGVVHAVAGLGLGIAAGSLVRSTALATYISVAQRALSDAGLDVAAALEDNDLPRARQLLPALVGRDPSDLDASEISQGGGGVAGGEHGRRRGGPCPVGGALRRARHPRLPGGQHHGRHRGLSQRALSSSTAGPAPGSMMWRISSRPA